MAFEFRRVVTGLDKDGRSCILFNDTVGADAGGTAVVWHSDVPVTNLGSGDAGARDFGIKMLGQGTSFIIAEMPVGSDFPMHATNTIDYIVVLRGEITLLVDTGEVALGPGDLIVDRGVIHAWRIAGPEPALLACFNIEAEPVGQGATI